MQRPIADLEEAYRSLADLAAVRRGNVALGALPSAALSLLPAATGTLRLAHPALKVRVVEAHNDELVTLLRTNQIEFAVAAQAEPVPDLAFTPLGEDCFCAVYPAGHPLDDGSGTLHWRDVLRYDLILLSQGSNARQQFDRAVRDEVNAPATALRYDVTHMGTAAGMVRQGLGVSVLPRLALPELNLSGLRCTPLGDASARRYIGLLHRRDRSLSPAAQALVAQLANAMADIQPRLLPLPRLRPPADTAPQAPAALAGAFGNLDQVQVGIAQVDGAQGMDGSRAAHRAFDDGRALGLQAGDHFVQRDGRDKAQVQRARHGQVGLGLEFAALDVQVDFLVAEPEGFAALAEGLQRHAQEPDVEIHAGGLVRGGEDEVVEMVDHDGALSCLREW